MTKQFIIDRVLADFPDKGFKEIERRLTDAAKIFATKTKMIRDAITVTTTTDDTEYTLDTRIVRVDRVSRGTTELDRLTGHPIRSATASSTYEVWYVDGRTIHLGYLGENQLTAYDADTDIVLHCRVRPLDLDQFIQMLDTLGDPIYDALGDPVYVTGTIVDNDAWIAEELHETIIDKVKSDLWLDRVTAPMPERIAMHRAYREKWKEGVRTGQAMGLNAYATGGITLVSHRY